MRSRSAMVKRHDAGLERERLLEKGARGFVNELYGLADVIVGHVQAREVHRSVLPRYRATTNHAHDGGPDTLQSSALRVHPPKLSQL